MDNNPLIRKDGTHKVTNEVLTAAEIRKRQIATAMKDPEHLKAWLRASGHQWLVLRADDLVDALAWPFQTEIFMDLLNVYTYYRMTLDSGRRDVQQDPLTGKDVEVVLYKDDTLEEEELDRAIRHLTAKMYQLNPQWSLDNAPL